MSSDQTAKENFNNAPDPILRMQFDTSIAEFNTLRTEQLELIKIQYQLYNYIIIISGALLTVMVTLISRGTEIPNFFYPIAFWLVLLLPILSAQVCFLFFDQELVIHAIGSHIDKTLYPRIKVLVEELDWNFHDFWNFKHLNISTRSAHHTLYHTRWILFLVPTYVSTGGILIHSLLYWGWWNPYLIPNYQSMILILIIILTWSLNVYLCASLGRLVHWTRNKSRNTKMDLVKSGKFAEMIKDKKFETKFLFHDLKLDIYQEDIYLQKVAIDNELSKSEEINKQAI